MKLFHVTTRRNWRAIRRCSHLKPELATGARKVSWFVPERLVAWAIGHVQVRHDVDLDSVVVLEFDLPRGWCSEHAGSDKWFTRHQTGLECLVDHSDAETWFGDIPEREEQGDRLDECRG